MNRLPAPEMPFWISAQLPFDRYMVEVGESMRMHVMEQGHGTPVVAFHGNPTWGYLYRKIAQELEHEPIRLIMPDLIGLGFSDAPESPGDHTLQNHSDWVSSFLDQLDVESAVAVVQDWGGPIGIHALSRHRGLMNGLVVLNTSIGPPKPGFTGTAFHRIFRTGFGRVSAELVRPQNWTRWGQEDRKAIDRLARKSYGYPMRRKSGRAAAVGLVRMVPDTMEHPTVPLLQDNQEFLESFDGPAAIVWGENDPVLGRLLHRQQRMLPQAEVTVTSDGHFIQEESPVEIAYAVRSVVARI